MKKLLIASYMLALATLCPAQDITGTWNGPVQTGKKDPLVIVFTIEEHGGVYTTRIDIPGQRLTGLQPKETHFENSRLLVNASNLGFTYQGQFNRDSMQFVGSFTEGANQLPLVLKKGSFTPQQPANRPQEPIRPYPYDEEEVRFENKTAGVTLAGTLTLPRKTGPFPVVVLITGSGPQDRDETLSGHKPFLVLADYLTRQGLAVLRYDDRGVGQSTGDHSLATTADFAADVMGAIAYLQTRKDIDKEHIGLIGHSEGGIIAPMVANRAKVSFIVSLAGTGIPGSELSLMQAVASHPFPVTDEKAYEQAIRQAITIASAQKDLEDIKKELYSHYKEKVIPLIKGINLSEKEVDAIIHRLVETRTTVWMRYFYNYNPADEIEKLTCPVLSLNGSKDTQVTAKINQDGIRNALIKGHNKDFQITELPGLNHMFQECTTGAESEYGQIAQTFSPNALHVLSDWILAHVYHPSQIPLKHLN